MKLYYMPGACSLVPHTALEWIGKPYDAQKMSLPDTKTPEYLALNPQGAVPLLVNDEFILSQNMAILLYLDQLHPEAKILGAESAEGRAKTLRWLSFLNADLHKAFGPLFHLPDYVKDEQFKQDMQQAARKNILKMLGLANEQLAKQDFLGDAISVADVYLYVILRWCAKSGIDYSELSHLAPFYQRMAANPGVAQALEQEGLKP